MSKTNTHARWLFGIAAAYNFIAGAQGLIASSPAGQLLGMPPAIDPTNSQIALVLVLTFGWGYWQISRDPVANRPIIVMGIIGKSLVALVGWLNWLSGHATDFLAVLVTGDAVFAALFFHYLRRTSPAKRMA